jgi:hypothetical protein
VLAIPHLLHYYPILLVDIVQRTAMIELRLAGVREDVRNRKAMHQGRRGGSTVSSVFPFSVVARLLGILLLVAAGLKVWGLGVDPVPGTGVFSAPELQIAFVEFEVALAVWLCLGVQPIFSWLVSLLTFTGFAIVSSYLAWIGESSCGCFGRINVNPLYALAVDSIILTSLTLGRPDLRPLWESRGRILLKGAWGVVGAFAGVTAISGVLLAVTHYHFRSVPEALAYLRGERISVRPRLVNIGEGHPGDERELALEVANWTDKPIRLIGGAADCSCSVNDLPLTIPPGETRYLFLTFRFSGKPGIFTRRSGFLVDDQGMRLITFRLTGRIAPNEEKPGA